MLNNNSNIKQAYQEVKSRLIKLTVEVSKSLTTFALLEEMVELQAQFCYSYSELQCNSDEVLMRKCYLLHNKLSELVNDLVDYNINKPKLNTLLQTIEDFNLISMQITVMQNGVVENETV
jgi:hypothetical protein